jgi:hypothetical protein
MRLAVWAAMVLLVWSLAILAALVTGLGAAAFHAIVMAAVSLLPAFLVFPTASSAGQDAIRRIDGHASVEAWLGYPGGPAGKVLGERALETLTRAASEHWNSPRTPRSVRLAIIGIMVSALTALAASQAVSVRAGQGLVFAYPEKPYAGKRSIMEDAQSDPAAGVFVPGTTLPDAGDAQPGASRRLQPGPPWPTGSSRHGDPQSDADIATDGEGNTRQPAQDSAAPYTGGTAAGQAETRRTAAEQLRGSDGQAVDGKGDSAGGPDPTATARTPGWEGSGSALEASPIVDYSARFEREYTDATGREAVLGDEPTAAALTMAIAAYYETFDLRVMVGQPLDPELARMQAAWLHAFGNGAPP